ncbi:MAG: hypothetical protein J6I49_00275 [Bacteroidales bacterium]|nr:hypothetical protein [Bacteroidales bacterium]
MENIRISFEVPGTGPYTVNELTERARRFVSELVAPQADGPSDEALDALLDRAFAPRSIEEEAAELNRRVDDLLAGRATTVPHDEIVQHVMNAV